MLNALKQKVTVQPGGIVQVQSSELMPGSLAEVIVIPEAGTVPRRSLTQLIGSAAGGFASPDEADAFLRHERNAWHQ
jgi:hypothetical protein